MSGQIECTKSVKNSLKKGALINFGANVVNDISAKQNKINLKAEKDLQNSIYEGFDKKLNTQSKISTSYSEERSLNEHMLKYDTMFNFLDKTFTMTSLKRKESITLYFMKEGVSVDMIREAAKNGFLLDLLTSHSSKPNLKTDEKLLAGEIMALNSSHI